MTIDKGQKNEQLLVQPVHTPMSVEQQIAVLYCGTHGLLRDIPLEKVPRFEKEFIDALEASHRHDVLDPLKKGEMNDHITGTIEKVAANTVATLKK